MKSNIRLATVGRFKYAMTLFSLFLLLSAYALFTHWPSILITTIHWQKEINAQLSTLLYDAQVNPINAGLTLIGLSFVYGLLHSLGPGHGKLIVSTYIATHPTKVKESLMLTLLSSLLQAVVAIALVTTLLGVFNSSMHAVNNSANFFITLSFYGVALLGFIIIAKNIRALWKLSPFYCVATFKINSIKKVSHRHQHLVAVKQELIQQEHCGCGHVHVVNAAMINQASSFKEYLMIIVSIGMRPCSGAIMVLLFAYMMNIYWLGIISAFAMAAGTVLTTSIIAMMTITGKKLITLYSNKQQPLVNKHSYLAPLIRLSGGIVLLLMASLLLSTQVVGRAIIF